MTTPAATPVVRSDREAFEALDWGLFAAVGLIWGSSFLLIKVALDAFHPGLITWARVGLGAAALLLLPAGRKKIQPVVSNTVDGRSTTGTER